jgi:hypothetical protein
LGTNEDELNRVVISRCEVDMIQIKEEYETLMKRTLEKHVQVCSTFSFMEDFDFLSHKFQGDTSGDYRKILLELLKDPSQRTQKAGNGNTKYP